MFYKNEQVYLYHICFEGSSPFSKLSKGDNKIFSLES